MLQENGKEDVYTTNRHALKKIRAKVIDFIHAFFNLVNIYLSLTMLQIWFSSFRIYINEKVAEISALLLQR